MSILTFEDESKWNLLADVLSENPRSIKGLNVLKKVSPSRPHPSSVKHDLTQKVEI